MSAPRPRLPLAGLCWLLALASFTGCAADAPPPNIVLVSIDSLRPDHLGVYGYSRPTSPNIDRIASEGILFENAYSVTSWTLPAHLSMLSGLYPDEHGVVGAEDQRLASSIALLPERLAQRGYVSAAVVSGPYLNRRYGYAQGWKRYDDALAPADRIRERSREAAASIRSPQVHERALEFLAAPRDEPFFLFLHYFDVHYDYLPPHPWDRAFDPDYEGPIDGRVASTGLLGRRQMPPRDLEHLVALYDGEIAWVDHWIGELDRALIARGLDRSTLLVVTADHGEEFLEHGRLAHRKNLFDTTLRVPLVVRRPDRRFAGARVAAPVSLVDIAPTILRAAGAGPASGLRGRDLLATRLGKLHSSPGDLFASLDTRHGARETREAAIVRGPWKLIAQLDERGGIDLAGLFLGERTSDPTEQRNRAYADPRFTARFVVALRRTRGAFAALRSYHAPESSPPAPEVDEQLRSLGYL